jgi:hypothetical protein
MRPGVAHRVEIGLDGPDRISVRDPAGAESGPPSEVPALLRAVPSVYRALDLDLDLAFLVELGGTDDAVRRRVGIVAAAIRWIVERHPDPEAARFAVVGYGDHRGDVNDVTRVWPFAAGDDVLRVLPELAAETLRDPYHAPVEDALAAASDRRLGWRAAPTRRALVTVGSRPPHPPSQSESHCPRGLAWRNLKSRFTEHQVQMVTVWDPPPWSDRDVRVAREARQTWAALGRSVARVDAQAVVAATGGIPGVDDRAPLLFPIVPRP